MSFIQQLNAGLDQYHLLKHPFYQDWNAGVLSNEILQTYAKQYYPHVAAFPRYVSNAHSLCENIKYRQILLENLIEEDQGEENHPELWIRFAEGLGCTRSEIESEKRLESTNQLVEGYFSLARQNFPKALGLLYGYERQTPEIAQTKIDGLKKFYGITNPRALQFFAVHIKADEWHSAECASIIAELNDHERQEASEGAIAGAKLLWGFLDGINELCHAN